MPIYEYDCLNCGVEFEELVLSSQDIPVCPACQSSDVSKKVSVVSSSCDNSGGGYSYPSGGGCTSFG